MKISTCTNKHFQRKIEVLSEFDSFLMYIDNHTKSHNFLKISMFPIRCSLSVVVHTCWKKSTFLTKFNFFPPKSTFLHKIAVRKTLVTLLQSFARHDFITVLKIHSFGQKLPLFALNDISYQREITPPEM